MQLVGSEEAAICEIREGAHCLVFDVLCLACGGQGGVWRPTFARFTSWP